MAESVSPEEADSTAPVGDAEEDLMNLIGDTLSHKTTDCLGSSSRDVDVSAPEPEIRASPSEESLCDIANVELRVSSSSAPQTAVSAEDVDVAVASPTRDITAAAASPTLDIAAFAASPTFDIAAASSNTDEPSSQSSVQNEAASSSGDEDRDLVKKRISAVEESLATEKSLRTKTEADLSDVQSKLSTSITERDAYIATIRQLKEDHAAFAANGKAYYEKRLQDLSTQLNQVANQAKERDHMARNAIEKLKQESSLKINDLQKRLESAVREKDLMVVRYAEGETKVIKVENENEKFSKALADVTKDKEVLLGKVKAFRDEKAKMQQQVDAKQTELANAQKEVERVVENFRQSEQKARWLQGKMAAETEGMGEMKQKIERLTNALKDAKEDAEKLKKNFENTIREYQKKEDEKETDTTVRQQEVEVKRIIDEQLIQDKERRELGLKTELESAVKKSGEVMAENNSLKSRYKMIEEEKLELVSRMNDLHQELVGKNNTNAQLGEELRGAKTRIEESEKWIKTKEEEAAAANERASDLERSIQSMKEAYEESHAEVDNYSARNAELLSFTEKVSSKNTQLLSEASNLKSQLSSLAKEKEELLKTRKGADEKAAELRTKCDALQSRLDGVKEELEKEIAAKTETVSQLQQQLEDEKNQIKVMKKKHAMAIKELSREIQGASAKKFFEGASHGSGASSDTAVGLTLGSRAGSMNSLDNLSGAAPPSRGRNVSQQSQRLQNDQNYHHMNGNTQTAVSVDGYHHHHHHQGADSQSGQMHHDQGMVGGYNAYPEIAVVDIDKQKLVEKIVKLQKAHARKNEKMELMEEQIKALLVDVGRKDKVIQHYALREETGSVSSERSDHIKMQLSQKGGSAMGSVFSAHHDGTMTLDLSLEINRKMQALLEDTLLKNMTLKENMETLGEEIANLSRSNRELNMELQIYKKISGNNGS